MRDYFPDKESCIVGSTALQYLVDCKIPVNDLDIYTLMLKYVLTLLKI